MQRLIQIPRADWRSRVEAIGLNYHSHENGPYWDESACYRFESKEVDELEAAANALHFLCIDAAEAVIKNNWWSRLAIPEKAIPALLRSWERDDFSLYGRFDLAYDGTAPPKLLEYNADTPTALLEAAVAQWFWLQETNKEWDQFNSIHERLVNAFKRFANQTVHFAGANENLEDRMTLLYLQDCCEQAGAKTKCVFMEDIGWDPRTKKFVDVEEEAITHCFKLYPWEWLWQEEFSQHLENDPAAFIEPQWKMLLSNKGLLPILWELFPDHPNLLPAFETPEPLNENYCRKPRLSREGSNIELVRNGDLIEKNEGAYGREGFVYQAIANIPEFNGNHPIIGAWIIEHEAAGIGIREDTRMITGNLSRFIPHYFVH